jgi:immunity protein, SdpI family
MTTNWRRELLPLLLIGAMFLLAALSWGSAPARIPVHWTFSGHVDRWGGKLEGLLAGPLEALGIYLLTLLLPRLDPGRANYERFAGAYYAIRLSLVTLLAVLYGVQLAAMHRPGLDVAAFVPAALGGLFIVIGNFLGKIRPNWFVGVRTPWTLSSKRSWTRTHRLAGKLFLLDGLLLLPTGFLWPEGALAVLLGGIGVLTAVVVVYSYLVWKDDPERVPPAGTQSPEHPGR